METKLTAVEWLFEKLPTIDKYDPYYADIFQQAKAMEKEQMIEAVNYGCSDWGSVKNAEQYYNETYINEDDSYVPFPEPNEEWDVTLMDGIEYESWDELYDDYVGEADLHEFVQWLKDNFQVPNKLGPQNP